MVAQGERLMKVGVFWVYEGAVFGKARPVSEGQQGIKDLVDSPDDHVTVWESPEGYCQRFPELRSFEYQEIPRGRVLFNQSQGVPLVYLDKTLNRPAIRELIASFFGFDPNRAKWMGDVHYTTHPGELEDIFSDDV